MKVLATNIRRGKNNRKQKQLVRSSKKQRNLFCP